MLECNKNYNALDGAMTLYKIDILIVLRDQLSITIYDTMALKVNEIYLTLALTPTEKCFVYFLLPCFLVK